MWSRLSVSGKVQVSIALAAIGAGLGVAMVSLAIANNSMTKEARSKLQIVAQAHATELESYLGSIEDDITLLARSPALRDALGELGASFGAVGGDPAAVLQQDYIDENPNPTGSKHLLNAAGNRDYDRAHETYHPWLRSYLEARGYYDIFLFVPDGDLVYTVFKERDYATNFASGGGEWAGTGLGEVFRSALSMPDGDIAFVDFAPYAPSFDAPASFMATPIVENGRTVGVLAVQMPIDRINEVMSDITGLGDTGEAIIVGAGGLMRNDSRFTSSNDILSRRIESPAIDAALAGEAATARGALYRDEPLLQVSQPFDYRGVRWAVVAMQATSEAFAAVQTMTVVMAAALVAMLAVIGAFGFLLGRSIGRPLSRVVRALARLSEGDHDVDVPTDKREDDIGDMYKALGRFRDNAIERMRLEAAAAETTQQERARQQRLEGLIADFRTQISSLLEDADAQVVANRRTADVLLKTAADAQVQTESAAHESQAAAKEVEAVATAAEELTASIRQLTDQAEQMSHEARVAREVSSRGEAQMADLGAQAQRISSVAEIIQAIAAKTNLLALNATIEAARAGEAGRGFAVVASEVKELAEQTAKSTDEINDTVASMQTSSDGALAAFRDVVKVLVEIEKVISSVGEGVEQQDEATREIAASIARASSSSASSAESIAHVQDAARTTNDGATKVTSASSAIQTASSALKESVDTFLTSVASDLQERRTALRMKVHQAVVVRRGGERLSAVLTDLSEGGAHAKLDAHLANGELVEVIWPDGRSAKAIVAWSKSGEAGLNMAKAAEVAAAA